MRFRLGIRKCSYIRPNYSNIKHLFGIFLLTFLVTYRYCCNWNKPIHFSPFKRLSASPRDWHVTESLDSYCTVYCNLCREVVVIQPNLTKCNQCASYYFFMPVNKLIIELCWSIKFCLNYYCCGWMSKARHRYFVHELCLCNIIFTPCTVNISSSKSHRHPLLFILITSSWSTWCEYEKRLCRLDSSHLTKKKKQDCCICLYLCSLVSVQQIISVCGMASVNVSFWS